MEQHKVTIICGDNELQVDGVFGGITDNTFKVLFKGEEITNVIKELYAQDDDKKFTIQTFHHLEGVKPFDCRIIDIGEQYALFKIIKELPYMQRRQYFKIKINIETQFKYMAYIKSKKTFLIKKEKGKFYKICIGKKIGNIKKKTGAIVIKIDNPIRARIDDLSAGGLLFVCGEKINVGRTLLYQFEDGEKAIDIIVLVLRRKRKNNGDYAYGCKFIGLSRRDEEFLVGYVFRKQASMLRNRD